jgi:quinol-cytochrome oxidoreductase complex cytochrome b subunit
MATEIEQKEHQDDDAIPFFPDHALTEYWVAFGFMLLLLGVGVLGQFLPVGLEEPADPYNTPLHVKPEWYFLGLYQLLKFVPKTLGVLIPIVGMAILVIWPFLDRKDDSKRARMIRIIGATVVLVGYAALTIWGELS